MDSRGDTEIMIQEEPKMKVVLAPVDVNMDAEGVLGVERDAGPGAEPLAEAEGQEYPPLAAAEAAETAEVPFLAEEYLPSVLEWPTEACWDTNTAQTAAQRGYYCLGRVWERARGPRPNQCGRRRAGL